MKNLFIFGHISTALEISEVVRSDYVENFNNVFFVVKDDEIINGNNPSIIFEKDLNSFQNDDNYFIISVLNPIVRQKCFDIAQEKSFSPFSVISKRSYISPSAKIGMGVYIAPNASVSVNAVIKDHCIINYNVVIGHDSLIETNCNISPGASIAGCAVLRKFVLIGSNAFVFQSVEIGEYSKVDAVTNIFYNIEPNSICSSRNLKVFKQIAK